MCETCQTAYNYLTGIAFVLTIIYFMYIYLKSKKESIEIISKYIKYGVIVVTSLSVSLYIIYLDHSKLFINLDNQKVEYIIEKSKLNGNSTYKVELENQIKEIDNNTTQISKISISLYFIITFIYIFAIVYLFLLINSELKQSSKTKIKNNKSK